MIDAVIKKLLDAGTAGLIIYLLYRLVEKWAPQFLAEQQKTSTALTQQSVAMTQLAEAQRTGLEAQHEMGLAMRALAAQIERQEKYLQMIEEHILGEGGKR